MQVFAGSDEYIPGLDDVADIFPDEMGSDDSGSGAELAEFERSLSCFGSDSKKPWGRERSGPLWSKFSPATVDLRKCMAREFNGGLGEQCRSYRVVEDLCQRHTKCKALKFGRVDGPIPRETLKWFTDKDRTRLARVEEGEPRKDRRKRRYYMRHWMWEKALLHYGTEDKRRAGYGALTCVEDLHKEEYEACLDHVEKHLKDRMARFCGNAVEHGEVFVLRDKGPRDYEERNQEWSAYNGENGGRVFKYYEPRRFVRKLAAIGRTRETCTERECTVALRAVSMSLRWQTSAHRLLDAYAGPQCHPQIGHSMSCSYPLRPFGNTLRA
jgi:hypothetical protein